MKPITSFALLAAIASIGAASAAATDPVGYITHTVTANVSANATDPSQSNVTVSYDARLLPVWNLYPPLPLPGQTISRTSTIRIGGI